MAQYWNNITGGYYFNTSNYFSDWTRYSTSTAASLIPQTYDIFPFSSYYEIGTHSEREYDYIRSQSIDLRSLEKQRKAEEEEERNAKEKARILLLEHLDEENKLRFLDNKPLEIPSKLFKDITYQIPISYGRIKALKDKKIITELCVSVT